MSSRLTPAAIQALKDALCCAFWHKSDLRSFLQHSLSNPAILGILNWDGFKRQIVSDLVDHVVRAEERLPGDLTRLSHEVSVLQHLPHLEALPGAAQKLQRARAAVAQLRATLEASTAAEAQLQALRQQQQLALTKLRASAAVQQRLAELRQRYLALISPHFQHSRGIELERLLYDLFELFDLDPQASFHNTGEQIEGSFSVRGMACLLHAQWQPRLISAPDLDAFASRVRRRLDHSLGVFLSVNGFAAEGVQHHGATGSPLLLVDGADLLAVLEERSDLESMILLKQAHASQTGGIHTSAQDVQYA